MTRPYKSAPNNHQSGRAALREKLSPVMLKLYKLESSYKMGLIGRRYYELRKDVLEKQRRMEVKNVSSPGV